MLVSIQNHPLLIDKRKNIASNRNCVDFAKRDANRVQKQIAILPFSIGQTLNRFKFISIKNKAVTHFAVRIFPSKAQNFLIKIRNS